MTKAPLDTKLFRFQGTLWQHPGQGGWHFVTLSAALSKRIKLFVAGDSAQWGSVKVEVQIRSTSWSTSVFPDRKRGAYLLPVKSSVRRVLKLGDGDVARGTLLVQCKRIVLWD